MGNLLSRNNSQTTDEVDVVIHEAVDSVTEATRQALKKEEEKLKK